MELLIGVVPETNPLEEVVDYLYSRYPDGLKSVMLELPSNIDLISEQLSKTYDELSSLQPKLLIAQMMPQMLSYALSYQPKSRSDTHFGIHIPFFSDIEEELAGRNGKVTLAIEVGGVFSIIDERILEYRNAPEIIYGDLPLSENEVFGARNWMEMVRDIWKRSLSQSKNMVNVIEEQDPQVVIVDTLNSNYLKTKFPEVHYTAFVPRSFKGYLEKMMLFLKYPHQPNEVHVWDDKK